MKIKLFEAMTLHCYNLKWGIAHISQPFLDGYEVVLEDDSIHWCPKELFNKLKLKYETKGNTLPVTLA